MDINDELNKLNNKQLNYVLYVTRKQVVWVDFEGFSYCIIDQLRAISKLRIQTKKFVIIILIEKLANTLIQKYQQSK